MARPVEWAAWAEWICKPPQEIALRPRWVVMAVERFPGDPGENGSWRRSPASCGAFSFSNSFSTPVNRGGAPVKGSCGGACLLRCAPDCGGALDRRRGAMAWWSWLVLAATLLAVELFVVDAQFYLVFLGVSAALVGLLGLTASGMPEWQQWLAFALLSLVTMVAFRERVYNLVRNRTGHVDQPLTLGDRIVIPTRLEPGQTCRADYRGSSWTARNVDQ